MKNLTQKEVERAFKENRINELRYFVEVEGKTHTSEFTYGGLRDCQYFIHINGKPNKKYEIKVIIL